MLRFLVFALLALHSNCQNIIELRNNNVVHTSPVKTIGLSHYSTLPVNSYLSSYPTLSYGLNINGVNNIIGKTISPSVYNVVPQHRLLSIQHQPTLQHLTLGHTITHPRVAIARPLSTISQPIVSVIPRAQVLSTESVRPVAASIQQVGRTVEYRDVPNVESPIIPQDIVVEPNDQPINIHFRSRSSTVKLSQEHIPSLPVVHEQTRSQDEPDTIGHEVVKPVIQEVKEVVQPYRQVTQEVQPVVENVHRIISQGNQVRTQQYGTEQTIVKKIVEPIRRVEPLTVSVARPALTVGRPAIGVTRHDVAIHPLNHIGQPITYTQNAIRTLAVPQTIQPYSTIIGRPVIKNYGINEIVSTRIPTNIRYQLIRDIREPFIREVIREPQITQIKDNERDDRREDLAFVNYSESQ